MVIRYIFRISSHSPNKNPKNVEEEDVENWETYVSLIKNNNNNNKKKNNLLFVI